MIEKVKIAQDSLLSVPVKVLVKSCHPSSYPGRSNGLKGELDDIWLIGSWRCEVEVKKP